MQWQTWESNKDTDPEIFHLVVQEVLHIRVPIRIMMDYVQSTKRENQVNVTAKTIKKAGQEDIDKAIAASSLHLDKMGHADIDLAANAAAVLKAGGSNPLASCSDIAQTLPDIRALLPAEAEDEDDEDEDESEDDVDPDAKSKGKGKGKNNAGGWWRKEEFQIKKETELETMIKKEKDAMDAGYKLLKKDFEAHLLTCSPACLLSYLFAC